MLDQNQLDHHQVTLNAIKLQFPAQTLFPFTNDVTPTPRPPPPPPLDLAKPSFLGVTHFGLLTPLAITGDGDYLIEVLLRMCHLRHLVLTLDRRMPLPDHLLDVLCQWWRHWPRLRHLGVHLVMGLSDDDQDDDDLTIHRQMETLVRRLLEPPPEGVRLNTLNIGPLSAELNSWLSAHLWPQPLEVNGQPVATGSTRLGLTFDRWHIEPADIIPHGRAA